MTMIPIPRHLSHLPLCSGLPVPMVVSRHRFGHHVLALSKWPGYDLQTEWVGEDGPPDFGKYDDERLRVCMSAGLCHVCGERPRYPLVCVPREPDRKMVEGKPATLLIQPWVCGPCLGYAVQSCPPLMGAIREGRGLVFSITKFRMVGTLWKRLNEEDPIAPEGARVVSMFKILPMKAAVQRLPEWCQTVGRKYRIRTPGPVGPTVVIH